MLKSPVKYLTDRAYSRLPIQERALHQARSHVGEEEEWGPNRSAFIDRILGWLGVAKGSPWCATFVSRCLVDAGFPKAKLPSGAAAVRNWVREAEKLGCITQHGQRGDLVFMLKSNGKGHIGFITGVGDKYYSTIEGNTVSDEGISTHQGVYPRRRPLGSIWKAIDMAKYAAKKGVS